jgi:hypothetical protein
MVTKKEEKQELRRFEEKDRKPWTEEQRKAYVAMRDKLKPFIVDLTTPAPTEKKKDPLAEFLGL